MNTPIKRRILRLSPPAILALGFLFLIGLGTVLLSLPFATHTPVSIIKNAFTATSAVTVTGLAVVNTDIYTAFGQVVIMFLIQAGGLGFMTFAVLAFLTLQGRVGVSNQLLAREAFGGDMSIGRIVNVAKSVVVFALFFEIIGFILLTLFWLDDMPVKGAIYSAFFYTISAFNNAGFGLTGDNLAPWVHDIGVNLTISALFILGGLGFLVLLDVREKKTWKKFSTNTKVVLFTTMMINVIAFVLFWLLEANNPDTLEKLPAVEQAIAAWFGAVAPRTAGFNTLPVDALTDATTIMVIVLMFIGAGSLSTASGIKVGTFAVLLTTTWAYARQHDEVTLFKRRIPEVLVKKALALTSISIMLIVVSIFLLALVEPSHDFDDVVFEVVSALGTVGLTRGITTELTSSGELVIMFMMFAGRVGPLTLAYLIATPKQSRIRYPKADIQVG